ncbi:MAG: bifunctional (p)ppGpp synthetase/guanosine-3',5'-bis(diphosphate) 3'-pyrophosphohydrolase [Clostridia bacterium]|nr:bifunctional (p)ppGpp synthetase/guanosine-3',5'-bis(diphosphate) 3'-pyrophosphohydrolase [Clostridia bacterium]
MQRLLARCELIYSKKQRDTICQVLEYAIEKHGDQRRVSGEPYISHPIAVANILIDLGMDYSSVCAALLHDTIEDTDATEEDIKKRFGEVITELVVGVTKLKRISFTSKAEEQAENFRKMFFAMAKDIRVLIIKLADRLHNMRTVEPLSIERQTALANETLEIYARLASRLGLSYIKCEMEDICLKVLHPTAYESLVKEVSLKRKERQIIVDKLCHTLRELMDEHKIAGEVSGRPKHFYSIYKKMNEKHKTFEQIYDLTAVRIIVENVESCYEVLGLIHSHWKPIPGRFKDYIAVPKPNNYQSLHTTVMTNYGTPFEIQIRTYEMHKIAEYGIAAHWKYKENSASVISEGEDRLKWLRGVINAQGEAAEPQELYESLKVDLYEGQVFIFTPKGDVVPLPEGSTPIDFACSVHSEIGNRCIGAKINNRIVPLETKLSTGDYVEIITSNNAKGPSRDWLRVVKTTQARTKIRAWFKKEMKEENIHKGKEMMELEAKRLGYALPSLMKQEWLDVVMHRYSISSIDDLYASIGYNGYSVHQILPKLIDFYRKEQKAKQPIKSAGTKRRSDVSGILINGEPDMLCHVAKCCSPVPGDEIVGYVSNGRGVTVHRKGCINIKYVDQKKLIDASWGAKRDNTFVVYLQIQANDKQNLVVDISTVISELKLSLISIVGKVDKNDMANLTIGVCVSDISEIDILIKKLQQLSPVRKVHRSSAT